MNYLDFVAPHENADEIPDEWYFERFTNWRNRELQASDWTQIADSTADKTAWQEYRQELRDLPAQNVDPKKIKFPTRPEA
jgi:hypothetical protein